MSLRRTLFGFQGRMRRRTWWGLSIAIAVAAGVTVVVCAVATGVVLGSSRPHSAAAPGGSDIVDWIALLPIVLFAWPSLAIAVKRGHDIGIRAVWVLIPSLLSYYIPAAPLSGLSDYANGRYDAGELGWAVVGLLLLLSVFAPVVVVCMLGFHGGTRGPNRFGPSPKGLHQDADRTALVFD